MTATLDTRPRRDRVLVAAIAVIVAAVAASAVILLRTGGADTPIVPLAERGDPHAPREVSRDLLNAVDKVTRTASQAELVAEGRDLFRSSEVALDGEACQSCHTDGAANADVGTTPHGVPGTDIDQSFTGPRDPITLFGAGETDPYMWDGSILTLNEVSVATILNHFKPAFKDNIPPGEVAGQAAALTAYMETIEAPTTDFDRGTMSPAAQRGLRLFQGAAGCVECHGGPNFTDGLVHNILVPQAPPMFTGAPPNDDHGAALPPAGKTCPMTLIELNALKPEECAFNTPILRGVGLPGAEPFFHNGFCRRANGTIEVCDTLEKVVEFYNSQSVIAPLGLTADQRADLVELLKEL